MRMSQQRVDEIIRAPHEGRHTMFLEGPAGAGKTTLAVARLRHLLEAGVPGDDIIVLTPQRTLAAPYHDLLRSADLPGGSQVTLATIGGLARRAIDLFWPLVAEGAVFSEPRQIPPGTK